MTKPNRLGAALTALGLVTALAACAANPGKVRSASIFGGKVDQQNIGLATRAQAALAAEDYASAIRLAEQAVGNRPNDAGFRALLGNSYFAAGRFASAEAAYHDSLALLPHQPQLVLKMALVQIAQGKNGEALGLLQAAQGVLDPADHGLALALAGQADEAVSVLDSAARGVGADARVRQNLALAHALRGDWVVAREVAAQDVAPDQLDARLQQWMALAQPGKPSDQVAALVGVTPAATDPGQPVRLALARDDRRVAAIDSIAPVQVAAPLPAPVAEPVAAPPVEVAMADVVEPAPVSMPVAAPEIEAAPVPMPAPIAAALAAVAPVMPMLPGVAETPKDERVEAPRPSLSPRASSLVEDVPALRQAARPAKRVRTSRAVVQLGAYSSRDRVSVAWNRVSGKFAALRGYSPMTARFEGGANPVYRLSVHGFSSRGDAVNLCASLKKAGANCFVREVAGDAPVQFASR